MKNLFIQSFMDSDGQTFLEVGSTKQRDVDQNLFDSIKSDFNVTLDGTCFISILESDFKKLKSKWNVSMNTIQIALRNQWSQGDSNNCVIFHIKK